ncbi:MAG: PEP/pyruvate-binding domain-containing protein [Thermodesulfobacteriota bacterium]
MKRFFKRFRKRLISDKRHGTDQSGFKEKYESFKQLLAANNRALEIIADLEHIIYENKPFTFLYAATKVEALIAESTAIAMDLNRLSGGQYEKLLEAVNAIGNKIRLELFRRKRFEETSLVLQIEQLSLENASEVGGKAANLGEVFNRANLPVPLGFAITAYAYEQFLRFNNLTDFINGQLKDLDINDPDRIVSASREIQNRITAAPLQSDLEHAILQAACDVSETLGKPILFSVRSSATSEDSEASFAGQHSTLLNISEKNLIQAYKEVVASIFNARAIFYRRSKGYHDQDVAMSVVCIMMVDASVSGVMYTLDPNDSRHSVVMISSVWGLAALAVEGSVSTDFFQIDKKSKRIVLSQLASKQSQLRCRPEDGLIEEAVPEQLRSASSLTENQIHQLVDYALRLEKHYGQPLDIEWAIDRSDKLFILQSRPLKRHKNSADEERIAESDEIGIPGDFPILIEGGATACEGVVAGFAYVLETDHMLHHIPQGAIVVAGQTSPRYVQLLGRIKGFITDVGSVTGHMASVAREFHIPTLVGTGSATRIIPHGETITLDATRRKVYQGTVKALIKERAPVNPMANGPIYQTMKSALRKIAPLNLIDPKKENFSPEGCQTLHDIIRFAHEMAMREMFHITDGVDPEVGTAVPLKAYLPLRLLVIDLGNGMVLKSGIDSIEIEDIRSIPFKALLRGMKHEKLDWHRNVGISLGGLTSIIAESVFRDPMKEGRMGGPGYAIVADHYLNFNSRLGYHFATIDTYCGESVNDNYVTFYFKGGAADIGRRSRRAMLISGILKRLGFKVEQKADMVRGELKKYQCTIVEEKLDLLGRLLGSVRLLDMVLSEDRQVEWYQDQFLRGNYRFEIDEE